MLRASVEERAYGVAARVLPTGENGEELPKSDRVLAAFKIQERVRDSGFPASVVDDEDGGVAVLAELGDYADDEDFCQAADAMLQAASW